ncbi:Eco47II family restriction endonuclease [Bacteroides salyersiae]|uniref:Eco47II family restriction endonuclease n=1 Tax=Bacteroides salyersiae TaxID=291644 RepID=UPI001B8C5782|nr:Eco47II family restriction endonuclease [Bacteroides salyersiae]MBT9871952.1 Eco47II family restriction endonuclease [Bacteroides salyersiae]MCS2404484.1 Eco47II family restriction endonuclease [Bacteroides salyersiae]QUT76129.1 Eco47II restriction endonuclease [Bacteroides salyersiae]UBD64422.1 Eco47II family restriction endonuclease [Bacteroides salyersiae]
MRDYNLGFISNEDIYQHVKETVGLYRNKIDLEQFNSNIIDPIKLTFDSKIYGKTFEEIIEAECIRQVDKTNTNHIGYFHQNLFKYVGNGWEVPAKGFDVINNERHIFVELKNKHNTMNSGAATSVYANMQNKILHDDQATCMLVEVIATKSRNEKWNKGGLSHEKIRRVSIDKFYGIVFDDDEAFFKLCRALPGILDDVIDELQQGNIQNSVYEELSQLSPDTFKSLYLLAFATYDGFQNF